MPWETPRSVPATAPLMVHPTDLRTLVDSSPVAVVVADARGLVRFLNNFAVSLFGTAAQDLIGTACPFTPDDQIGDYARPDGSRVQLRLKWTQLVWEGNLAWSAAFEPVEAGTASADHERRAQEAEIRVEKLHAQVQALEEERVQAQEELQRREKTVADLTARCETLSQQNVKAESRVRDTEEAALQGWGEAEERARLAEALVKELQGEIGKMDAILREAREREEAALQELAALQATMGSAIESREQLSQAQDQLSEQLDRIGSLEAELSRLQAKANAREAAAQANDSARVEELEQQLHEQQVRADQAEKRSESVKARVDYLQEVERELRSKLSEATAGDHETKRLAFEDQLTGLPNANILEQFLTYTVDMVARGEGAASLLVVDVDRFRAVNTSVGNAAGDDLLIQVAERLKAIKRPNEVLARYREDEFVLVYSLESKELNDAKSTTSQVATSQAGKILAAMAEPFTVAGMSLVLTVSLGVTVLGFPNETPATVLEQAYSALERAREQGRARYQFYGPELQERARRRITLVPRLKDALERQELTFLYQPIVELKGGKMVGIEALLRWKDPSYGLLEPTEFLPTAEETGLILPIGELSFQEACQTANLYRDLFVSINVSQRQLLQADFPRRFMKAVERARVRPERIVVEVSEKIHAADPERISQVLAELSRWKIQVALDDFGTSSSSLSRMHVEGIQFIKLDPVFVHPVNSDKTSYHVCLAFCHLAATLELRSVAEGVEDKDQMNMLRKMGCQLAQGHYFASPVSAGAIKELVRKTWKVI